MFFWCVYWHHVIGYCSHGVFFASHKPVQTINKHDKYFKCTDIQTASWFPRHLQSHKLTTHNCWVLQNHILSEVITYARSCRSLQIHLTLVLAHCLDGRNTSCLKLSSDWWIRLFYPSNISLFQIEEITFPLGQQSKQTESAIQKLLTIY